MQQGSPESPHDSQEPPDVQISWKVPLEEQGLPTATQWVGVIEVSQHPWVH